MPEMFVGVWGGSWKYRSQTPGIKPDRGSSNGVDVWIDWPASAPDGISKSLYATVSPYDIGLDRNLTKAGVQAVVEGTMSGYYYVEVPCDDCDECTCWEQVIVSEMPVMVEIDVTWTGVGSIADSAEAEH